MNRWPALLRLVAGLMLLTALPAQAAQFVDHGPYRIHYSAFSSLLIPAEVARLHGITRSENEVVVNIAAVADGEAVTVAVAGLVTNLLNQQAGLNFVEVREADAIYYLAAHTAFEEDTLRFQITVTPPEMKPVNIEFLRRYD